MKLFFIAILTIGMLSICVSSLTESKFRMKQKKIFSDENCCCCCDGGGANKWRSNMMEGVPPKPGNDEKYCLVRSQSSQSSKYRSMISGFQPFWIRSALPCSLNKVVAHLATFYYYIDVEIRTDIGGIPRAFSGHTVENHCHRLFRK